MQKSIFQKVHLNRIMGLLTVLAICLGMTTSSSTALAGFEYNHLKRAWQSVKEKAFGKKAGPTQALPNEIQAAPAPIPRYESLIRDRKLLEKLPAPIQRWLKLETEHLSREYSRMVPAINNQNQIFSPEAGNVFEITGYWIDIEKLKVFKSSIPAELHEKFFRQKDGKEKVLFLVHPESYRLYTSLLTPDLETEKYLAAATSSSRSLLVWREGQELDSFIAKLSLDVEIGGVVRSIKGTEAAMSIGIDRILKLSNLPAAFRFFSECFSVIPKGLERGGMIIRAFPEEMKNPKLTIMPLFSLYAINKNGKPPLAEMIAASGLSPDVYVRTRIIEPFIHHWVELAVENGILTEPHAQNVLIEIGENGQPTGRFFQRDFGGFNIDLKYRQRIGLEVPELPTFTGNIEADYYQSAHGDNLFSSLHNYFEGGFVYNLDRNINEWIKLGWIKGSTFSFEEAHIWILNTLKEDLARYGSEINMTTMDQISLAVSKIKLTVPDAVASIVSCQDLFAGAGK